MMPGGRVAATLEILTEMLDGERPLDQIIRTYFADRRYAGSKDRRAIAEQVYGIARNSSALSFWMGGDGVTPRRLLLTFLVKIEKASREDLLSLFQESAYGPSPLTDEEQNFLTQLDKNSVSIPSCAQANVPAWLWPHFEETFGPEAGVQAEALNTEAPTDLRTNTLLTSRETLLKSLRELDEDAEYTPLSPVGIRLSKRLALERNPLLRQGLFEFQDEASQLAAQMCDVSPDHRVLDFCAGAGGKTLALAALMGNQGHIDAVDADASRLMRAHFRAQRAGVENVYFPDVTDLVHESYDRVLVDAPCSGTGTWRRHPEWRLTFTPQRLENLLTTQENILTQAASFVRPGGSLIYMTCSVLRAENQQQVEKFINENKSFSESCVSFKTPHSHACDGFYVAVLQRA